MNGIDDHKKATERHRQSVQMRCSHHRHYFMMPIGAKQREASLNETPSRVHSRFILPLVSKANMPKRCEDAS
jgi:GTP cyclohydrolase I